MVYSCEFRSDAPCTVHVSEDVSATEGVSVAGTVNVLPGQVKIVSTPNLTAVAGTACTFTVWRMVSPPSLQRSVVTPALPVNRYLAGSRPPSPQVASFITVVSVDLHSPSSVASSRPSVEPVGPYT